MCADSIHDFIELVQCIVRGDDIDVEDDQERSNLGDRSLEDGEYRELPPSQVLTAEQEATVISALDDAINDNLHEETKF